MPKMTTHEHLENIRDEIKIAMNELHEQGKKIDVAILQEVLYYFKDLLEEP